MPAAYELSLRFTSDETNEDSPINVSLFRLDRGTMTNPAQFLPPLDDTKLSDLRWYLEVFSTWPTGPDYERATEIEAQLEVWGRALLQSVIGNSEAARLWQQFVDVEAESKLLTVDATDPRVLRLPWELLADESGHIFAKGISVRRRLQKIATTPAKSFALPVRILVIVARPDDAGFIDPRAVSRPLLDALNELGSRVEVEFLPSPTLQALTHRLRDRNAPPIHVVHFDGHGVYDSTLGLGFLIFENDQHQSDFVDANRLGTLVSRSAVPLMVLNACQSASQQGTNPYASIASRLIRAGVGSVLAMNYSVLVVAAHKFVEGFYGALVDGLTIGQAVDEGRFVLLSDEQRHTLTRYNLKNELVEDTIRLRDWFLPSLYQQAVDPVVFNAEAAPAGETVAAHVIPLALIDPRTPGGLPLKPVHDFHGREYEILQLERSFATHPIVVLYGFGGLGKTSLAAEAGRWFYQTKRFPGGAAFVSFEHGGSLIQLCSWVGQAISGDPNFMLGDGDPVERIAALLQERPALIILDNFESVLGQNPLIPADELQTVLDATWKWATHAKQNSARSSRILITTRDTTFNDARFSPSTASKHIELQGLTRSDALALATAILRNYNIDRTKVNRRDLVDLIERLGGHPLSLNLVLPHLRQFSPSELSDRFEELLPGFITGAAKEREESLTVSLEFSLRRLSERARAALPDLAVFQGGAMEYDLLAITQMEPDVWKTVRTELEQAALMTTASLPGMNAPYIQFHPTLLPYLASLLPLNRRAELEVRYRKEYYASARMLFRNKSKYPHAILAITLRELPNLQHALQLTFDAGEIEVAIDFADCVMSLLDSAGRWREKEVLLSKVQSLTSKFSTIDQYDLIRHQAESLRKQGRVLEAIRLIKELLPLTTGPDKAILLTDLGRCFFNAKQYKQAIAHYEEAIQLYEEVGMRNSNMKATCHAELAGTFSHSGKYQEAQAQYELAQDIYQEINSLEGLAFVAGNLGILAYQREDYVEAIRRHQQARQLYHTLNMPREEAVDLNQLGLIYQDMGKLDEAEKYYREALKILENMHDLLRMNKVYNNLGTLAKKAHRPYDAEQWYLQGIQLTKQLDPHHALEAYGNLAILYLDMNRLDEAQAYAQQAVSLIEQHDLQDPQVWQLYAVLGAVAEARGQTEEAAEWQRRTLEHHPQAGNGPQYQTLQWASQFIGAVVAAIQGDETAKQTVATYLSQMEALADWQKLSGAVRMLLAGTSNADEVLADLDPVDTQIIRRILTRLAEPESAPGGASSHEAATTEDRGSDDSSTVIAALRREWQPILQGIVAACAGDTEASANAQAFLAELSQQNEWQNLAAALQRILDGERSPEALLLNLDATDTLLVGDVLHALGVAVADLPSQESGEEELTLDNFLSLVAIACQPDAQAELTAQIRMVADDFVTNPHAPQEIQVLGRIINAILSGERNPDLTGLTPEIGNKVSVLLATL